MVLVFLGMKKGGVLEGKKEEEPNIFNSEKLVEKKVSLQGGRKHWTVY